MKKIILISGKLQSGKNKFAEFLTETLNDKGFTCKSESFAKSLKERALQDFKPIIEYINEVVYGCPNCDELHTVDDNFFEDKTKLTRLILQVYGTEIFRNRVNSDYWVDQLIKKCHEATEDFVLVTDVRFENEIEKLQDEKDFRVIPIRIERNQSLGDITNEHISEKGLDDYKFFEFIVENNDTLEVFKESAETVSDLIIKENC